MNTLLQKIKAASLEARKASMKEKTDKAAIVSSELVTLLGAAERVGKDDGNRESTDTEVVAAIKKNLKGINDTIAVLKEDQVDALDEMIIRKGVLESFLPKQLSEDEIESALRGYGVDLTQKSAKGLLFKSLKAEFDGQYDGELAKKIVEKLLS